MALRTQTVQAAGYELVVQESSGLMMMRRALLTQEVQGVVDAAVDTAETGQVLLDVAAVRLLGYYYIDLVAAVIEATPSNSPVDGGEQHLPPSTGETKGEWPPPFEEFIHLPEEELRRWEEAVYALNPHWLPKQDESGEKKG